MTKIYLVKLSAWNKETHEAKSYTLQVFTNKKKAYIYAEYKQLQAETEKPDYLSTYENITYKVEEWKITTLDWTDELVELQKKNLPY